MEQLPTGETRIDVSQDRMRVVFDRSRPHYVPGSVVAAAIPFDGNALLFKLRPSSWVMVDSHGTVRESELVISFAGVTPTVEEVKRSIDQQVDIISRNVEHSEVQVREYREKLPGAARSAIERRRSKLLHDRGLEGALGVRVRRRGDAPTPVPIKRKRLRPTRPASRGESYRDEYRLDDAQYEEIIDIILSMGRAFERSPTTFAKLSEEELRDHILLQLNGTFEGHAGGEVFNGSGKTDILVRIEDRNVFIAECKFWRGPAAFREAIDQLLGYLVWRDTKAALVLFIRQQNATGVIEKAVDQLRSHACFKRNGPEADPSVRSNLVLHQKDDDSREIIVALLPVVIRTKGSPLEEGQVRSDDEAAHATE